MRDRAATSGRAIPAAALLAALGLCACASAQKPPAVDAPAEARAASPAEAAAPATSTAATTAAAPAATTAQATPADPARARAAFAEGVKAEAAGDLAAAAAAFDRASGLDPDLAWASFNAGLLRERLGDDARAVAAYERAMAARPGFAPAGQNLARVWLRQGLADLAERRLRERLSLGDGVALRVALAEVLLSAGKLDEAEGECRAALKADEKNVPAMVVLATTYARKKRFELSRMVLENARQVEPGDPAVWNRLGFVELALGNRAQAIDDFKAAAALRPDYPEAHANHGALLADADDFAGAAVELELAVKYAPRSAAAWLLLGNARRGLQEFEKAEQAYRKALELDPALNDANFNLAVLYLDVEKPGLATLSRLEQGLAHFDRFETQGGVEPRVAAYRKDAARELDRERKRLAREEKDRSRKEAEARRKADDEARLAAEAKAKADEEARVAAEAKAKADAEAAAKVKEPEVPAPASTAPPQAAPSPQPSPPAGEREQSQVPSPATPPATEPATPTPDPTVPEPAAPAPAPAEPLTSTPPAPPAEAAGKLAEPPAEAPVPAAPSPGAERSDK